MGEKERQSNFEVLRIISMVLIVMSHCDELFGLADLYSITIGVNKIITDMLHIGGQIGVGCFVLISGYFMIEKNITVKKILKLAGEVWFYTIGIWAVWLIYGLYNNDINIIGCIKETICAFFPIVSGHYWFVTAYVILMILSPFFNKLIFSLTQKEYRNLLISVVMIFVVLKGGLPKVIFGMSDRRLIPVFIMYFIAGYIKRFRKEKKNNARKHFSIALTFYLLLFVLFYLITLIGVKLDSQAILEYRYFYGELNSPLIVVICTEMFITIFETDISYNKIINKIAGCTFGVYLIHSNRIMYGVLQKCFPIYKEQKSLYIFLYSVIAVLTIYVFCTIVDFIRAQTFGKLWDRFLDNKLENIQSKVLKFIDIISGQGIKALTMFYDGENNKLP